MQARGSARQRTSCLSDPRESMQPHRRVRRAWTSFAVMSSPRVTGGASSSRRRTRRIVSGGAVDGSTHRLAAASASLSVSAAVGAPVWQAACAALIATATSSGWTSPDADQSWLAWVPGGHRGLTHWWGLPALAVVPALLVPPQTAWAVWALLIGWSSHLVGDFVFGRRPRGVPMAPWWGHAGLGLDSGGGVEKWLRRLWPGLLSWQLWVAGGGTAWPDL